MSLSVSITLNNLVSYQADSDLFACSEDEDKDREETEKMIHASDISQIEIDLAKVTSDKPKKFMTPLELRYRNNLHMNGGHGTLSMPHDMRQKLNSKRDSFIQRYNDDPLVETISDHWSEPFFQFFVVRKFLHIYIYL